MATTRNERRRRWFLRTWAASGWVAKWRAAVWATEEAAPWPIVDASPRSRRWAKFATHVRVPSGVRLEVRHRHTVVSINVPLTDPYLLIGNHSACGLRLDGLPHGEIQYALCWLNGELYGVDLRLNAAEGTDAELQDGWWSDNDVLRLGEYTLRVRGLPGVPARMLPIDDQAVLSLHLESAEGRQEQNLSRWLTIIGRAPDCGVVIRETGVAPRQAALIRTPVSLWLVNLSEGTPPRIDHHLADWSLLDPHDEFTFGPTRCHAVITWPENFDGAGSETWTATEQNAEHPASFADLPVELHSVSRPQDSLP